MRRLHRLPAAAVEPIWQVLGPMLAEPIGKDAEQRLDAFCAAHSVIGDDLARSLKACRFLIRAAATVDLAAVGLAEDLETLCPGDALVRAVVLAGYEPARVELRRESMMAALVDHGKLLTGVNWRVDAIEATERGVELALPVAMFTLHYREGAEVGRVTLQLLPDMIAELRRVCDSVLSRRRGAKESP